MESFKEWSDQVSPEAAARTVARQAHNAARVECKTAVDLEKRSSAEKSKLEVGAAAEANRLTEDQELKRIAKDAEAQSIIDEAYRKAKRDER